MYCLLLAARFESKSTLIEGASSLAFGWSKPEFLPHVTLSLKVLDTMRTTPYLYPQ